MGSMRVVLAVLVGVGLAVTASASPVGVGVAFSGSAVTGATSAASAAPKAAVHAAAAGPQPAFYTYQAPGGAATLGQKVIALTFDDGPGPYTPQVLSVLERYHVAATFFEIGVEATKYPQYTRMVAAAGYPVEDHTWSHADLATIPVSQFPYEIDQTQAEIRSLTGRTPTCVRPPYDAWDATSLSQIAERGLTTMSYSIDPRDWALPGTQAIVGNVVNAAFPGAVVDMHDAGGPRDETVAALPQIITDLRARGFRFVSICGSEPSPASYRSAVYSFGSAPTAGSPVVSKKRLVGAAVVPTASGYWLVAADGGIFSFGDARYYGSTGGIHLTQPVVGIAPTLTGRGYWLVAADGGIFSFGDARYYGSTGGVHLTQPVVGMGPDRASGGYWLVAADGGVFSFHAPFYGSRSGHNGGVRFFSVAPAAKGAGYLLAGQH